MFGGAPRGPEFLHCSDSTKSAKSGFLRRSKHRLYSVALEASTILGRRIVKVEPLPGLLSTAMVPPIIWQKRLLIASPRPVPPYLRVVDASAWENSWNS